MDSENTGTVTLRAINMKIIFLKHDPHQAAVVRLPSLGIKPSQVQDIRSPRPAFKCHFTTYKLCALGQGVYLSEPLFPYLSSEGKQPQPSQGHCKDQMKYEIQSELHSNYL